MIQRIINFIVIPFICGWMIADTIIQNENVQSQIKFNNEVIKYIEQQDVINKEQNSINADLIDTIGLMQQGGY